MSDTSKMSWTPDNISQLARELNNYGAHYRNAVACLYNTFSYELSKYWTGKNYNKVAEFVNGHYDYFDTICIDLCATIPMKLQDIAYNQAVDGHGAITTFNFQINDPNGIDSAISFNKIPMTKETADGSISLTQDLVEQYINGSSEPSLSFYRELMGKYLASYLDAIEQLRGIEKFNAAVKFAYDNIQLFAMYSDDTVQRIMEQTKLRADAELGKITEADAETKDLAVRTLTNAREDHLSDLYHQAPSTQSTQTTNKGFIPSTNSNT